MFLRVEPAIFETFPGVRIGVVTRTQLLDEHRLEADLSLR